MKTDLDLVSEVGVCWARVSFFLLFFFFFSFFFFFLIQAISIFTKWSFSELFLLNKSCKRPNTRIKNTFKKEQMCLRLLPMAFATIQTTIIPARNTKTKQGRSVSSCCFKTSNNPSTNTLRAIAPHFFASLSHHFSASAFLYYITLNLFVNTCINFCFVVLVMFLFIFWFAFLFCFTPTTYLHWILYSPSSSPHL